jgi:nucleoside-diphosphate-sugar epimerase
MNILISGSTGFVGVNLVNYLTRHGHNSISLDLRKPQEMPLKNFDIVIHLAGKAHDLKNSDDGYEYVEINYGLTKIVYDSFLKSAATKFIFISSVKAVVDHVDIVLNENCIPNPQTDYGKSKLLAEKYIEEHRPSLDKDYYILRPCMIHGPGNKGNLNLLYKIISLNVPYPLAAFENYRSFLSVENLCFVIKEIIEQNHVPSGIYNVADDEALSTNELVRIIATVSGRVPRLWKINKSLVRFLAKVCDFLKLPLTSEKLEKLTENFIVDNSKILMTLNRKLPIDAREGITVTVNSFQKTRIKNCLPPLFNSPD